MGKAYKINPEINAYILEEKKLNPRLSCRRLSNLVKQRFQYPVSKSTINGLFRETGLSMPIGRRKKVFRASEKIESSSAVFLKAADSLVNGSSALAEIVQKRIPEQNPQSKIEDLIFSSFFEPEYEQSLKIFLENLDQDSQLIKEAQAKLSGLLKEVLGLKVVLSDGSFFYIDSQLHTVWPKPNFPACFASPIFSVKQKLEDIFFRQQPLCLLFASGYESATADFFNCLESFSLVGRKISRIILLDNALEEIESINIPACGRQKIIFGVWPWQFQALEKLKINSEFSRILFRPLANKSFVAQAELELQNPKQKSGVKLNGYCLKSEPEGKIKVIILANSFDQKNGIKDIIMPYLYSWPSLEESFRDFSLKIEALVSQGQKPQAQAGMEGLKIETAKIFSGLCKNYFLALEFLSAKYFLPQDLTLKSQEFLKKEFYALPAARREQIENTILVFKPKPENKLNKYWGYAFCRLNEKKIFSLKNKRLWGILEA